MKRALDNKIFEAAERAKVEPDKAVVVVDMSNVVNWKALKENKTPANDEKVAPIYRVSVPKMSSYLESLSTHPLVKVFSPHVYIPDALIRELTDWVMGNCPEILNSSDFTDPRQTNSGFNVKLARAIRNYMAEHGEEIEISAKMRAKMSTLTRAETWLNHKERFVASGFQVIGKAVNFRNKTLVEDKTHASVVTNVLQEVDDMQRDVGEMKNFIDEVDEGRADLRQMILAIDKANSIFNKVSQHLHPEELAQIHGIIREFRGKLAHINKAAEQIRDQIVHAPSKKCDLDVDIVAETLDPETLKKYGVFIFYSGDGDFKTMYKILHREGKRVVVASPDAYLAKSVKDMAARGEIELHKTNFEDNIWREIYSNPANKKPA